MNIQTVLFDLDGTLIDTNELIHASFEYTFATYNYSFTREEIMQFNGPPLWDTFHQLNPELADKMMETYQVHNHKHHEQYIKVFPNVEETLIGLRELGIKLAVVTAKKRVGAELGLKIAGLDKYFDTIITVDDVEYSKPHPESVLKAMQALDAEAHTTIMVGDNYHDIEAGKNANTLTAGVAWTLKGKDFLATFKPTYMLEDMKDLLRIVGE
ncbi:pyrophosphatase PpaX [Ornithinibacillus sp. 4-3]|uniref:Pyrophosphatase PpaX n=1 Tax=Ornithinibacillus sp. 4-3 TaxID=3231488 RepID=A0AB39HU82_9BACI